jgi:hypothetical protein
MCRDHYPAANPYTCWWTGLKLCGPGKWLVEKHAIRTRRSGRKLRIGVDADTGQIIASFTGDGASHRDDIYREVCQRHPEAARSRPVPSATAETAPTKRDRHFQLIAERGRIGWRRVSGYNWRALV